MKDIGNYWEISKEDLYKIDGSGYLKNEVNS